ncbi:TIGR02647 family protein [Pseudomonas sp. F1_0610]|uniref:TIGR02647 family protein n=1 Tax=Pseudomonas sp. F1_0610 TaxID=3114284 RepID=UPI0039C1A1E7
MNWKAEYLAELEVLSQYGLDSVQDGIKVHSSAGADTVAAAQRLFDKGLINQVDGGTLTSLGIEAVEHVHALLQILK